ncbi:MAG: hypothetical protein ACYDCN_13700 [Bacteroidia bacterium]
MSDINKNIEELVNKINDLQETLNTMADVIKKMERNTMAFGDWISEEEVLKMPNVSISRSRLWELRKQGRVSSSSLNGKQLFYRLSDFKKLLDENEQNT